MLFVIGVGLAQNWTRVWKLTIPPYLTLHDITEMGMVKAGFDTDQDGWGEIICTWTNLDTNAICMYEADGNNSYKLVWSWVYPAVAGGTFASIAVGDINNNGIVDIVTTLPSVVGTDPNPPRLWVFEWNGVVGKNAYGFYNSATGKYDPSTSWNYNLPDNYDFRPYSLTIEDIDKDGKDEYPFVNYSPSYDLWPDDSPLWLIEIDVASDVKTNPIEIPSGFQLLQNYPNPFNPSTTIPYRLANRSLVHLDVFDVYGQHIASLVNAEREPGWHQAKWTGMVPSGTYFCRLLAEPLDGSGAPFRDTKKMLLVR